MIETRDARYLLRPLRNRTSESGVALPHTITKETHTQWNSTSKETPVVHSASTSAKGTNVTFFISDRKSVV